MLRSISLDDFDIKKNSTLIYIITKVIKILYRKPKIQNGEILFVIKTILVLDNQIEGTAIILSVS